MDEFLALCGFDKDEVDRESPRLQKTFNRLGITEEDVLRGKLRLATYFDMDLQGIRKLLRIYMKELANMVLARDEGKKTVIHACMAGGFETVGSAIVSHRSDVYVEVPNPIFMVVLGSIFDKFVPILEAAERLWLKSGVVAHCGMVKSRLGLIALNLIPRPDMMVTSGLLCETSPKTNDLIHEVYDIDTYCYDTCQDREDNEYPDAARTIALAAQSMKKTTRSLMGKIGFDLSDGMIWEALHARSLYGQAMGKVFNLVRTGDPIPMSPTHENLLLWMNPLALTVDGLMEATEAVNLLHGELQDRIDRGIGVTQKGAPRILGILPPHHADPRLEHLVTSMGMALVGADYGFMAPANGADETKDPYVAASQHLRSSLVSPLGARIRIILGACKDLGIDGVLDHYHTGCRGVAGDAFMIRDAVAKELGIPVLVLEWENFDPRVFDDERFRTRLEVFRSMMQTGTH